MTFLVPALLFALPLRFSRQRRGVRRQRCRVLPASATPLPKAPGCPNVQPALDGGVVGAKGLRLAPLPPHSKTLSRFVMTLVLGLLSSVVGAALEAGKPAHWPEKPYDTVIGYQFANPWGIGGLLPEKGTIELDDLRWLQARSVKLEKPHVDFLLKNTFASENKSPTAACYEPHHVFVFYAKGVAVAAVELCFLCNQAYCWPDAKTAKTVNFPALRHLCTLLKLGTKEPEDSETIIKNYMADPKRKAAFQKRMPEPIQPAPAK